MKYFALGFVFKEAKENSEMAFYLKLPCNAQ